jgi:hypothetical protein
MSTYVNTGTDAVDNILKQTAFQIGPVIHRETLNTEAWDALIPKSELPTGAGDSLSSLVFNRALPTTAINGSTVGVDWARIGGGITNANTFALTDGQHIEGAAGTTIGSTGEGRTAYVKFLSRMRNYYLSVANIKSPYIDVHTVRTAAAMEQQLSAIQDMLVDVTRWTWARRHEQEYERNCGNFVPCLTATASPILSTVDLVNTAISSDTGVVDADIIANNPFFGSQITELNLTNSNAGATALPTGYISNAVLDRIYNRLARTTSHNQAYGMDNGRPVFALVCGSDASLQIKRENLIRDDVRESTFVDELLKPLGVNTSFRGFYHMTQDLIPRFSESGGVLTRVEPFDATGEYNLAYDSALYEAFYVVHKSVTECQVPAPNASGPGVSFNPVNYRGEFQWLNIQDEVKNPLKTLGFFYGTLASAYKPIKVMNGFAGVFRRDNPTTLAI